MILLFGLLQHNAARGGNPFGRLNIEIGKRRTHRIGYIDDQRSLQNFFKHRLCNRAQWGIREVAKQMYKLVYAVAPTLFSHSGPPCLYGPCPEGKMSCKKQAQVREEYAAMKERLGQ